MYTLTIDNFPPTLHARLQDMARHNQCSVTQQILTVLEQYLTTSWPPASPTLSETRFPKTDRRWLSTVKPLAVGITITEEWLDQAKEEGRE